MAETQKIVILNFGGQYTQLIARRVRECHVYSCVLPYDASLETIRAQNPVGVILSGGPASVLEQDAPRCDEARPRSHGTRDIVSTTRFSR